MTIERNLQKFFSALFCVLLFTLYNSTNGFSQQKTVTGKVTDKSDGSPLPGVTIKVQGSAAGTTTNSNGEYALKAAENAVLVFSYIGYTEARLTFTGTPNLNAQLVSNNQKLDEVVVIGYGTTTKKDATGAVATVSAAQIKDLPVSSVDQKLKGQIPGVQINTTTGTPGGGTSIKIRGSGSIGAGDNPLFVVDGYPISNTSGQVSNPLNVINPNDIESITVLKDASSTAIYGSRGSNGVIVITTKQGLKGTPVVNISAYTGIQQVPQKGRPQMLNGTEFAQFRKDMIVDDFASRGLVATDADIPEAFRNPSQYGAGTNWYNEIIHDAPMSNLDASISGGSENTKYNFSLGYLNQAGTIRYTGFQRYAVRLNTETKLGKKLKIGLNLAPTNSVRDLNNFENEFVDVLSRSLWLSPLVPLTDGNGNRTPYVSSPGMYAGPNPLNSLEYGGTRSKDFRGLGTAFAEYQILNGLKLRYSFNVDYTNSSSFVFNPSFVGGVNSPPPSVPNSTTNKSTSFNWLSEAVLTYDKSFGKDHRLNVVVGYSAQKERAESLYLFADNYPDDKIQTINAAAIISGFNADVQKWSIISYLARANYSYKDRYLFTATVRTDGSSRFGSNNRYGTFPSAAFAWRASEEEFMKKATWISDLKLRATYGLSGNYNIGNYTYITNIGSSNYVFGGQLSSGRVPTSLNNPNLTWEESSQLDAGIDLGILKNRLSFNIDYYKRITKGMLYNSEIPLSSGYSNAIINSGKIQNQGFEFGLTSKNLEGTLTWSTSANIAFNRNKVLALNENNDPIYSGRSGEGSYQHITQVGRPVGEFYGYILEGIYKDQADLNNSPKHVTSVVGSVKYKDVDGNGIIEPVKDFAVIGSPQPNFTWGLTNTFGYKGFDLNILLVGSQGGQILKTANQYLLNIDGIFNVDRKVLNRYRSPENPGDGFTPTTNGSRVIYRDVNSSWVESASYMRIQNITFGYRFGERMLRASKVIKGARIYSSIQNLATFTKYSGANPEVSRNTISGNAVSSALVPGEDFTNYPLPRTFTLGLNLTF
ncbi:SusC/RagA family TonB-linked outer membrane protein [Pedobacter cryoconitis]|uniref:TonB-linked SusC/RagA family outer membrane protein n=1 Tax=Pedobacter cryoconitis TaxID=188932 RepID=A0A327S019_9SPHI|nr:TonB-dependent receptor [Pedobacter cryoconitis]RAJ21033.1 TonB-linked SusC/RagA family outer membrane protein [Pedobacter cryoconitis]